MAPGRTELSNLLDEAQLHEAAECLKTLAHPHRLRIVQMLMRGRYTVGELAEACDIPSHMASEHLRLMRDRGLLDFLKQGRKTYYFIAESAIEQLIGCVEQRYGPSRG
jgi:DNA-binding transcriptional ArsR family regulator